MMLNNDKTILSAEGKQLLADPLMRGVLTAVAASVGVTAEEYLLRFETVLAEDAESIFAIFDVTAECTEDA